MSAPTIQAIDTLYRGCYFRSRLEARWAVFFDFLKIAWRYEPEAYRVGPGQLPYLPDFYLTDLGTWVEVKGDEIDFTAKADVYAAAVHPESGLPGIADSALTTRGLLILGPIPEVGPSSRRPLHTVIQHGPRDGATEGGPVGMWRAWMAFAADARLVIVAHGDGPHEAGMPPAVNIPYTATMSHPELPGPAQVAGAYAIARAVRFDQGKKGLVQSITAAVDRFREEIEDADSLDGNMMWTRSEDSVLEVAEPRPSPRTLAYRRRRGILVDQWDRRITADGQLVSQTPEHLAGMARAKSELEALRAKAAS